MHKPYTADNFFLIKIKKIEKKLEAAATEELDHLSWCQSRIKELGGSTSVLNPLLYLGSFAIGSIASITVSQKLITDLY